MGISFHETELSGVFVIEPERFNDERGFFARSLSNREFAAHGINPEFVEGNISFNRNRFTVRGMHFQRAPYAQAKLVRCTAGAIYDVVIDLRPDSRTFGRWFGVELSAENRYALFVPEGFAHGFQTLNENSEVVYQVSSYYVAESCDGVRWNDPTFGIKWPGTEGITINDRDKNYSDFQP